MTAATIVHHPACVARVSDARCTCPHNGRPAWRIRVRRALRSLRLVETYEAPALEADDDARTIARLLHPAFGVRLANLDRADDWARRAGAELEQARATSDRAEVVLTGCQHPDGRHVCPWHRVNTQAPVGALVARNGWRLAQRSDGRNQCGACTRCGALADELHGPTCPEYDRAVLREVLS